MLLWILAGKCVVLGTDPGHRAAGKRLAHVLPGRHRARESLVAMRITIAGLEVDDVMLSVTVPFLVYWATALFYEGLAGLSLPALDKFRIHDRGAELKHNLV